MILSKKNHIYQDFTCPVLALHHCLKLNLKPPASPVLRKIFSELRTYAGSEDFGNIELGFGFAFALLFVDISATKIKIGTDLFRCHFVYITVVWPFCNVIPSRRF